MNSIFVQFNADTPNPDVLAQALRAAGIPVLSVETSRWVRYDELVQQEKDAGPRLDVGLRYEAQPQASLKIAALAAFIAASPLVIK